MLVSFHLGHRGVFADADEDRNGPFGLLTDFARLNSEIALAASALLPLSRLEKDKTIPVHQLGATQSCLEMIETIASSTTTA